VRRDFAGARSDLGHGGIGRGHPDQRISQRIDFRPTRSGAAAIRGRSARSAGASGKHRCATGLAAGVEGGFQSAGRSGEVISFSPLSCVEGCPGNDSTMSQRIPAHSA